MLDNLIIQRQEVNVDQHPQGIRSSARISVLCNLGEQAEERLECHIGSMPIDLDEHEINTFLVEVMVHELSILHHLVKLRCFEIAHIKTITI